MKEKNECTKKQKFKERGVTLIALVITIIVLLILAGVALATLTGDSGILSNAEKAKEQTNLANSKEQVQLAVQGALTEAYANGQGTITREKLKNELDNVVGTENEDYTLSVGEGPWIVKVGDYEVTIEKNGKATEEIKRDTTTLPSRTGTTPWLPTGFKQVANTNLSNGLTITNATGTQNYVWIEVPTTEQTITLSNGTTRTINLGEAKTEEEIIEALELYAGKGTNYDYTKGSSSQSFDWTDEWYDSNGKTAGTDGANLQDDEGCGMTYSQYQTAYSSMLKSIQKYGGFWLAQYEAGIAYEKGNRESEADEIEVKKANYAKNQYPYNFVTISQAQKIADADSTKSYISSLPFGIQWDLVCKFLELNTELDYADIATQSTWGNLLDTYWTSSSDSKHSTNGTSFSEGTVNKSSMGWYLLTTGAIEQTTATVNGETVTKDTNPMNIYDFAGNVYEWSLEYAGTPSQPIAFRSGSMSNPASLDSPASRRGASALGETAAPSILGFRSVLY